MYKHLKEATMDIVDVTDSKGGLSNLYYGISIL